jgi:hypothetical protein
MVSVWGTDANAPSMRSISLDGEGEGSVDMVRKGEPSTDASDRSKAGVCEFEDSADASSRRAQSRVVG